MSSKRLGRVTFNCSYVVDLDDKVMVEEAKLAVWEDVHSAVKYDEVQKWIEVSPAADAAPEEIPEFLLAVPTAAGTVSDDMPPFDEDYDA